MHFVARCDKFPLFSFNVPTLRASFTARGLAKEPTMLHFIDRVFDSEASGLTDEEAALALEKLKAMTSVPPLYGVHIIVIEKGAHSHDGHERQNERSSRQSQKNLAA